MDVEVGQGGASLCVEGKGTRGERAVELGSGVLECKGETWNCLGEAGRRPSPEEGEAGGLALVPAAPAP